jgi:hypothetical protein
LQGKSTQGLFRTLEDFEFRDGFFRLLWSIHGRAWGGGEARGGNLENFRAFLPPPIFWRERSEQLKESKFERKARIKIFELTFETCRSSDVYNYMIVYIIIGHRSNKIQILLDIDEFFSFFFQKNTNLLIYFIFYKKNFFFFF